MGISAMLFKLVIFNMTNNPITGKNLISTNNCNMVGLPTWIKNKNNKSFNTILESITKFAEIQRGRLTGLDMFLEGIL